MNKPHADQDNEGPKPPVLGLGGLELNIDFSLEDQPQRINSGPNFGGQIRPAAQSMSVRPQAANRYKEEDNDEGEHGFDMLAAELAR